MNLAMPVDKPQHRAKLTHAQVWDAIDRLAQASGLSPSGLARRSGLDATSFNPSKRIGRDGRPRWPSTESIAKILSATDTDVVAFLSGRGGLRRTLPAMRLDQASGARFDPAGHPGGDGWSLMDFGGIDDPTAFMLLVTDDSLDPVFRSGTQLVVSHAAQARAGDRIVVARRTGEVVVRELLRRTQRRLEFGGLAPDQPTEQTTPADISWLARIVWASQ